MVINFTAVLERLRELDRNEELILYLVLNSLRVRYNVRFSVSDRVWNRDKIHLWLRHKANPLNALPTFQLDVINAIEFTKKAVDWAYKSTLKQPLLGLGLGLRNEESISLFQRCPGRSI